MVGDAGDMVGQLAPLKAKLVEAGRILEREELFDTFGDVNSKNSGYGNATAELEQGLGVLSEETGKKRIRL